MDTLETNGTFLKASVDMDKAPNKYFSLSEIIFSVSVGEKYISE